MIRSLIFLHTSEFRGVHPWDAETSWESSLTPPYVGILVQPDETGTEIFSGQVVLADGTYRKEVHLKRELEHISCFLSQEFFPDGGSELSLAEKGARYLGFLDPEAWKQLSYPSLVSSEGSSSSEAESSDLQHALDAMAVGLVGYLGTLQLLLDEEVFASLPFPITLPYVCVDGNLLNTRLFQYFSYPATAWTMSCRTHPIRKLLELLLEFINGWSALFEEGPSVDLQQSILDTVSGYAQQTVQELSDLTVQMKHLCQQIQCEKETLCTEFSTRCQDTKHQTLECIAEKMGQVDRFLETHLEEKAPVLLSAWEHRLEQHLGEMFEENLGSVIESLIQKKQKASEAHQEERLRALEHSCALLWEQVREKEKRNPPTFSKRKHGSGHKRRH